MPTSPRNAYVRNRARLGAAGSTHLTIGSEGSGVERLFQAVFERKFGRATCFLCGTRLRAHTRSDEHVIPLWVQNRFQILNSRLVLLNGTELPYRSLTIPCCSDCNNLHLGPIERRVREATSRGAQAVEALDQHDLFIWLGKIFYGMLYKEGLLKLNRARRRGTPIVQRELLQQFATHHLFLQSARTKIAFENFFPASIFVWHTQAPDDVRLQFDFRDFLQALFISIRLGTVGLVAVLQDGGALRFEATELHRRYRTLPLHPLQFQEIVAQLLYQSSLLDRTPKYISHPRGDWVVFNQMPLGGLSGRSPYQPRDAEQYASVLSQVTQIPISLLFEHPNGVKTWLEGPRGRKFRMNLSRYPLS